jgi:hypothetical protein
MLVTMQNKTTQAAPTLRYKAKMAHTDLAKIRAIGSAKRIGTWEGTFDRAACSLVIERTEGDTFDGALIIKSGRIAVKGTVNPSTRQISFKETRVIALGSMSNWILGVNEGFFSNDGQKIEGPGDGGGNFYAWSS